MLQSRVTQNQKFLPIFFHNPVPDPYDTHRTHYLAACLGSIAQSNVNISSPFGDATICQRFAGNRGMKTLPELIDRLVAEPNNYSSRRPKLQTGNPSTIPTLLIGLASGKDPDSFTSDPG